VFLRRFAVLLVAVASIAPARASTAPVTNAALIAEGLTLEARVPVHLLYGQMFGTSFATPDREPGQEVALSGKGDAGLWSGVYLAAESFRYAVARKHIADGDDVAAWQAQLDEAKARIDLMVAANHIRANIARNWASEPMDASRAPADGPEGGVFHGEAGLLFRNCFPDSAQPWQQNFDPKTRHRQVFGPLAWDEPNPWNAKNFYCEDAASRDTHAGTFFGWLTAFDLVGPYDPDLRDLIRDDVLTVTGYIASHGWSIFHPYSRVQTSGSENFIFPLFAINPQPRIALAQAARHVADLAGDHVQQATWDAWYAEELATMGPNLATEYLLAIQSPHNSYYNFNLNHITNFSAIREEPVAAIRDYLKRTFAIIDATTRDDVNAHFEAITYALTGEPARLAKALTHLEQWIGYHDLTQDPKNSERCGKDLACVAQGTTDWRIAGVDFDQPELSPTPSTRLRSRTPLPVLRRDRGQDFLWQRSPYQLDGGASPNDEPPGIDFLCPYWMVRYYTEVAPPALAPFPEWAGPTAGGSGE